MEFFIGLLWFIAGVIIIVAIAFMVYKKYFGKQ